MISTATAPADQLAELDARIAELREELRLAIYPEAVQIITLELSATRAARARL